MKKIILKYVIKEIDLDKHSEQDHKINCISLLNPSIYPTNLNFLSLY